jgi:predicted outer membrane protein
MIRKWLLTALACGVLAVAGCGEKTGPEPDEKEKAGAVEKAGEKAEEAAEKAVEEAEKKAEEAPEEEPEEAPEE